MAEVLFYEKPGCKSNARQKRVLKASGHDLRVKDLLGENWTRDSLSPFLRDLPVPEWFNPNAPRIKQGELRPAGLGENEALELLLDDALLIRRPLMRVRGEYMAGFDYPRVHRWIGLISEADIEDLENCIVDNPCEPT